MVEWPIIPLGELVDPERSICYGIVQPGPHVPDGVPILRVNNFSDGALDTKDVHRVSPDVEKKYTRSRLVGGELLVTLVGSIGQTAFAAEAHRGWNVARAVGVVPLRPDVDSRWVNFAVRGHAAQDFMIARANTTVQTTFNLKDLARLPIPLPPDGERIPMTALLSALDDKIELNRRMNATLERQARALFADWFVHFGPTRAKATGQPPYLPPETWSLFPDRLDDKGVPEGWESKNLGDVVEPRKGRNITKKTVVKGDVPVVAGGLKPAYYHNTSNVSGPVITASASGANAGFIRLYHQDIWASDCSFISREQTDYLFSIYALLSSRQDEIFTMQQGAAQPHIYPSDLKRLEITDAPKPIWQELETLLTPMFELVAKNELESRTLAQTRDLLLPKLMSGEVRVREGEGVVEDMV